MTAAAARNSRIHRVVMVGVALLGLAWLGDAAIDAYFRGGSFLAWVFAPSPHEICIRLLFLAAQAAFTFYILQLFRRRAALEQALADSGRQAEVERARAEAILEAIGDGISIQDRELRVLYQNRRHRGMVGDRRGEFCYRAYQGRDTACPDCHLLAAFADGQTHRREASAPQGDGRMEVEIVSTPLCDSAGEITAGIEAVRDITERKRIEALLQLQRTAMETASDGIAILDERGHYVYMNRAHAAIYGFPDPADLLGRSWRQLYTPEEIRRIEERVLPVCVDNGHWRGEATGRRQDGSLFPQEVSLTGLDTGGMVCVVRDVTRRKLAETAIRQANLDLEGRAAELAAANRELETFSYSLSHDIRSYLARISLSAQTLEALLPAERGEETELCLHTLNEASAGMEELIEAMLTLSRLAKRELRNERVDLSNIAREIIAELGESEPQRQVTVAIADDLTAKGDGQLLRVALENLLANAWKYTRDCPTPRIEFDRNLEGGESAFVVRDNGIGFDMAERERLFQPFLRLSSARNFPGTGIGLATVQRIVTRHNGSLTAEGRPGQGASFSFTLP